MTFRGLFAALSLALGLGFVLPVDGARADWERVGDVRIERGMGRDVASPALSQPVQAIRFRAKHNSVECRQIRVQFRNGQQRVVHSGRIREGEAKKVRFNKRRNVSRVLFDCASVGGRSRLIIQADYGTGQNRYYGDNQYSSWDHGRYSRGRAGYQRPSTLVGLGTSNFHQRGLNEQIVFVRNNQLFDSVDLVARGDAECSRATVVFGNGQTRPLFRGYMESGRRYTTQFSAPRRISEVSMVCQSVDYRSSSIAVQANTSRRY